ncbi:hypothetical protein ACFVH4_18960 [Nocardia ignorata]|uniref:hypothetical protein n=1 Tax=Nocardia ignorata TaxID=145285 RepID=UPI00362C87F6
MTREPVWAQWERAAERRAARLRDNPPAPMPSPPAPILPPEPVTPAVPGLLGWIVALIVKSRRPM